jgi:hypothetical protein
MELSSIEWNEVRSSNLKAVSYNREDQQLFVLFHGGRIYAYYRVPAAEYERLLQADSKGQYFTTHIRNRYEFKRLA